jgi:hypothetical protein
MTPVIVRTGSRLVAMLLCLTVAGCYIPGGGWTMRTGLDVRRHRKPSVFLELVDTRWDEYNRVATMNLDRPMLDETQGIMTPYPPNAGPGVPLPGENGHGPGSAPAAPPIPPAFDAPPGEPNSLPGTPVEALPPPPSLPFTDGPTARGDSAGDLPAPPMNNDDASLRASGNGEFDDAADDDEDLARSKSNWIQRVSGRLRAKPKKPAGAASRTTADDEKPALRPAASRLFSRPR